MAIVIHKEKVNAGAAETLKNLCPFGAFEYTDGNLSINGACKGCKMCVKKGPDGVVTWEEDIKKTIDKSVWRGITVFAEEYEGKIHPVTLELIGKARELSKTISHPVYAILIGYEQKKSAEELLHYGVDKVFVYDRKELEHFSILPYTACFADFIEKIKPSSILVGATNLGRSLAPRVAARMGTGLTADCTVLEMKENTDLVQIRPAFGGNIMAQIITPNTRPQFCTVRYKIFSSPERSGEAHGEITFMTVEDSMLAKRSEIISVRQKPKETDISEAEIIVAAGRGIKKESDLALLEELADLLGAQLAGTRPLIEAGWLDSKRQIGLSGRTVKPKLIITAGVSGSVQFAAGMKSSTYIVAINKDPSAEIFNIAHLGLVGDLYEIVPDLISKIKERKNV